MPLFTAFPPVTGSGNFLVSKYSNTEEIVVYSQQGTDCENIFREDISMIPIKSIELKKVGRSPVNWDSYGAHSPNQTAVATAQKFQRSLNSKHIFNYSITPSADGGIAFTFRKGSKIADIVFDNDGEIFACTSDINDPPKAFQIGNDQDSFIICLEKIVAYLNQ